jgi:hypothetical protein
MRPQEIIEAVGSGGSLYKKDAAGSNLIVDTLPNHQI